MSYGYESYIGDKVRKLDHRNSQHIKNGVLLKNFTYDGNNLSYRSQQSMFQNQFVQDANMVQHYGFASVPLSGAHTITLAIGGENNSNVIVSTHDTRYLPKKLVAGEVSIHDYQGQSIELKQDQQINLNGQGNININANNTINMYSGGNKVVSVRGGSMYVENIIPSNGWSGTFSTPTGQTVRVDAGIITDVS